MGFARQFVHIVHLLSQYEVTGAEVYAAQLAAWQLAQGHRVWILSDTFSTPTEATYLPMPVGQKGLAVRWANARALRRLLQAEGVHVVHAHSRAASKVGLWAVRGTEAALVSTVHGRQHWHGPYKRYDVYGQAVLAVCQNLAHHLTAELGLDAAKVQTLPNGVAFAQPAPTEREPVLLLAGRTSGPKGAVAAQFLARHAAALLEAQPALALHLAGGPLSHLPAEGQQAFAELQTRFGPDRVRHLGFVADLPARVARAWAVVGSGRVALEALAAATPLYAVGEAEAHGRVTLANWEAAAASNFGDVAADRRQGRPDLTALAQQLLQDCLWLYNSPSPLKGVLRIEQHGFQGPGSEGHSLPAQNPDDKALYALAHIIRQRYDLATVAAQVQEAYGRARVAKLRPGYIPVLMYHKVPLEPIESKHRIFVTRDTLAHQLALLKRRGYETITFGQYDAWRAGAPGAVMPKRPIVLTFDDGYLDNYTNAWPLLKRYGYTAVIYALGHPTHAHNFWDTAQGEPRMPLMSAAQMAEMAAAGIEFGAHTLNHARLTELSPEEALAEMTGSRQALQAITGQPVLSFAYPYGAYDDGIKALAAQAGFRYAVVISGGGMTWEQDRLAIFRVYVFPEDRGLAFWKKSSPWYRAYFRRKRGV